MNAAGAERCCCVFAGVLFVSRCCCRLIQKRIEPDGFGGLGMRVLMMSPVKRWWDSPIEDSPLLYKGWRAD